LGGLLGIYIADTGNDRIRHVKLDNTIETIPGGTYVQSPRGLTVDRDGVVAAMDENRNLVVAIQPSGVTAALAGLGIADGAPPNRVLLSLRDVPAIALGPTGILFGEAGRIDRISTLDGQFSVLVGDRGAINYSVGSPYGLAIDPVRGDFLFTNPLLLPW
jgi:hypothetical protein